MAQDMRGDAGVNVLLRPTKSLALFLQQIGRALRPSPGKDRAVILDHSGNVFRHGYPDLDHQWSLDGRPKKKKGKALVKRCRECGAVIPLSAMWCPECGADLQPPAHVERPTGPDPLIYLDPATAHQRWLVHGKAKDVIRWAGTDVNRLREVAAARNYKPGWIWHRLKGRRNPGDDAILRAVWGE
jgi:hypothetical protein